MNSGQYAASRRDFLQDAATKALMTGLASLTTAGGAFASGVDDTLKVGLIGCGGRGSGAASQALRADSKVTLYAMADAFEDRLETSLKNLQAIEDVAAKIDVPAERQFVGFDAYQKVVELCDVVLLCTPPHFRPLQLAAAVAAGKHVFAEKPCAVDAPGVRKVLAACEAARSKNLSIVSGLCLRYDARFREAVRRIHDGAIGQISTLQANDYRGSIWVKPRQPEWSDMTYQMRNWYYYTWLSGDFNVEQHVHYLDVAAWLMQNQYPVRAVGMGGRAARTGPEYGQIFDHFSVVYEYANGAKLFSNCRQQPGCANESSANVVGSRGSALLNERNNGMWIKNDAAQWTFTGEKNHMYQTEHDELFAAIRRGEPVNNGEYMAKSSLLAIMGRMAAYTGQAVTWDAALNSQEDLRPPRYAWDCPLPEPPVAVPGLSKFR